MKTASPSALTPTQAAMAAAGYSTTVADQVPAVVMTIQGLQKTWKTRLALTAPGPIAYHGIDTGSEGPLQDARDAGKVIFPMFHSYDLPLELRKVPKFPPNRIVEGKSIPSAEEIAFYEERALWVRTNCWERFETANDAAIAAGARTIIWDTETEVWEMKRLAAFGKLLQNPQVFYPKVNGEYKEFLRRLADADVNLILIRQLKEKFDSPGVYVPQGMGKIDFVVDIALEMKSIPSVKVGGEIRPQKYRATVLSARQARGKEGTTFDNPTFPELCGVLKPAVDADAWEDA